MQFTKSRYEQVVPDHHEHEYPTSSPLPPRQGNGGVVTLGSSIVAAIMFLSLFFSGINVAITVVSTVTFFGSIIVLTLLIDSGTLAYWLGKRAEEGTKREHLRLAYAHEQPRITVVDTQPPYTPPVEPLPALPKPSTFVPAVAEPDDSARREALAWLSQLYGGDGEPDPKKVLMQSDKERPGRIRIAAPSKPAKEFLLSLHVIHDLGNGYRLNLGRCPTLIAAQEHIFRLSGVGGSRATHPQGGGTLSSRGVGL